MPALPHHLPRAVTALVLCLVSSPAFAAWEYLEDADTFNDQPISIARASKRNGIYNQSVLVRCKDKKLEAYVDFDNYLGDGARQVRYRVDKRTAQSEKWWPSADGTAVFAEEEAEFARLLMQGNHLAVEVEDFRGVRHQVSFSLAGSAHAIGRVLEACNVTHSSAHERITGVRQNVALDIERWGPVQTSTAKLALRALGYYSGSISSNKDDQLYVTVSRVYDEYIQRCKDGERLGVHCDSLQIFWNNRMDPVMPLAGSIVYEIAPEPYKTKLGKLKMGD